MKILAASLSGFRSFGDEQSIRFDTMKPGLYHIAGRNDLHPQLEGNAVGKTSLFKGIYWTLFGEDDEGLRAGAVKNWHGKQTCEGILDVQVAHGRFGVFRSWKPNVLEVMPHGGGTPEPYDQPQFEQGLGITASAFLYSRYFAQFTPAFIDLKPAEQTALFSDALCLDVWERAAKFASVAAAQAMRDLATAREALATLNGKAQTLLGMAAEIEKTEKAWEGTQRGAINSALVSIKYRRVELVTATTAHTKASEKAAAYLEWQEKWDTALRFFDNTEAEFRRTQAAVQKLERDDYTNCPTCGAPVTKQHVKTELAEAHRIAHEAETAYNVRTAEFNRLDKLRGKYEKQREEMSAADQALGAARSALDAAQAEHSRLKAQTNPYTQQRAEIERQGPELVAEMEKATAQCVALEQRMRGSQYWPAAFKEIRLGLIRDSLAQFTLESNEALYQLGLHDWSIAFDVEKETQSGTIKSGFSALIKAPGSKEAVPFKAYCGGERQRLRMAVSLGFANLINSRQGVEPNVEFWDEPVKHVGPNAAHDFLSLLADRAERYQRVILLADHRTLDFGGFAGTITISLKDEAHGSIIE